MEEETTFLNSTNSSQIINICLTHPGQRAGILLQYIVSLVLGQVVCARLLWITLKSKHIDILNCNLALFHLLQYGLFYVQLFLIFFAAHIQAPIYKFVHVYAQVGGPMQLCFICLERFIAVIHPTYFPLLKKYRCREACVCVVWVSSVSLGTLIMFADTLTPIEKVVKYVPVSVMTTLGFLMVFTSAKVAKALKSPTAGKETIHPMKKRAFVTICVTSAAAMTCYVTVMAMKQIVSNADDPVYLCVLLPMSILVLSIASLIHPLFYLHAKGEFSCRRRTCQIYKR